MSNNIIFRKKFEKLINDENRSVIMATFDDFCSLKPDKAIEMLWELSVWGDEYYEDLKKLGISEEDILLVRNELRYQYELQNPGFCLITHSVAQDEINDLVNHAGLIEANVIFEHCISKLHGSDVIALERTLFLLQNEKENLYYGGIRDLGFGKEEADFLKPHHLQIAELFNALTEEKRQKVSKNTPLATLGAKLDEKGVKLPMEAMVQNLPGEEPDELPFIFGSEEAEDAKAPKKASQDESEAEFTCLTSKAILEQEDVFKCFTCGDWNYLFKLAQLGFDLNEVKRMEAEIKALLEATNALATLGFDAKKLSTVETEIKAFFEATSAFSK